PRVSPEGRLRLLRRLPRSVRLEHLRDPDAARAARRRVDRSRHLESDLPRVLRDRVARRAAVLRSRVGRLPRDLRGQRSEEAHRRARELQHRHLRVLGVLRHRLQTDRRVERGVQNRRQLHHLRTDTLMALDTVEFESADDIALADRMKAGRQAIISELGKRIIGQADVIELVLLTLFVGGNSLIVGVPGLAKTLLIATLAKVLDLKFNRIQFTPDLMPSDITGTDIIQEDTTTGRRQMVFSPGPVFANIVLADEINRTPPKTQAALLEAMQEHRVTIQGRTYDLAEPFYVFATQNPIELEGTYPLPEAQLDRFMFHIVIEHPPED